jgi:16S rRNA (adenine1518-N6/adenine1519-N6)-dimethyltransferase
MKKSFGQNFLKEHSIINEIIKSSKINKNSIVYEVGAGDGALTKEIIKLNPKKYLAIEIDKFLIPKLQNLFINANHTLVNEDALTFNEISFFSKNTTIISNLPYNISVKLLLKWIYQYSENPWFNRMVLMFQKEVGERILSDENSKKYGRISIISSAFFKISKVLDVDRKFFFPSPKVDSVVIEFLPLKKNNIKSKNIHQLEILSRSLFSNRRKKLKNKIKKLFEEKTIEKFELDKYFDLRAENLNKEIFYSLAKLIKI